MVSDDVLGGLADDLEYARTLPRFAEGTTIGDFELLGEIGRGGFGEVYLARHQGYGRLAALKFVPIAGRSGGTPGHGLTAPDLTAQLLQDVRYAAALNLANFVTVYGLRTGRVVLPDGGEPGAEPNTETFIEMEYAGGGDLARWRGDPRLTLGQLIEWLVPVANAIDQAHALGKLVHYDLKPQNILLFYPLPGGEWGALDPARLTPKVGDFGLARLLGDSLTPGADLLSDDTLTPYGTDGFAPPEQRDPDRDVLRADPRRRAAAIDGFALAATVYAMFSPDGAGPVPAGKPYTAPDLGALAAAGANADLRAVIAKQLDPDPRKRYPTVGEFAADLRRWLNGEAVAARNYRGAVRKAFWKQSWWVKGLAALLPVAVLGGLSAWAAQSAEAGRRASAEADAQRAEAGTQKALAEKLAAEVDALDKQKRLAEQERITAVVESAGRLQLAHEKVVVAARSAARRGNWPEAKRDYDAAIADRLTDALRLRVERLAVYFGLNDTATLERELAELEKLPDLGPLAAPVKLYRGTLLMCDVERVAEGREVMRQAREVGKTAPPDLYTPADDAYAAALIEERPNPVIAGLERAVALEPLHQPAQNALLVSLVAVGRLDDAYLKLAEVERLFPASTVPPVIRGLVAAVNMEPGLWRTAAIRAAGKQYEDRRGQPTPALPEFLGFLAECIDVSIDVQRRPTPPTPEEQKRLEAVGLNLGRFAANNLGPAALPLPAVHFIIDWVKDLQALIWLNGRGDDDAYRQVLELMGDYPDAQVRSVAAGNRFLRAIPLVNRRDVSPADLAQARALFAASAAHAQEAADAPYLYARSPQRYIARAFGLTSDVLVLMWTPDPDPVHFRRLRTHLPRVVADARGRGWDAQRDMGVTLITQLLITPETRSPGLLADWKLDTPAGREAWRKRERELYALVRSALDAWAADGAPTERYSQVSNALESWARQEWLFGAPPVAPPPRTK